MICEKCKNDHDGSFGSGRFCSRPCANSRTWTDEINARRSNAIKNSQKTKDIDWIKINNDPIKIAKLRESVQKNMDSKLFEDIGFESKRKRILSEQNNACNKCNLDTWLGQIITLEIEHKDGNSRNNSRNNMEALCPNCHSQTLTWRGRNNVKSITDEELIDAILTTPSHRQALIKVGMAPKGGNYTRIHRLVKEMKI